MAKVVRPYKDRVYTYHFLRQTYREGRQVKHRTLANLSHLPPEAIELIRGVLKGEHFLPAADAFDIVRSLPHGHVAAVLGTLRRLGLDGLLDRRPSRMRELAIALIVARVIEPASKLATSKGLSDSTLTGRLGLGEVTEDDLYGAMDWLLTRQARVERALAARHLADGSLVLYDLTSTYVEGRKCPLARHGYSRDHRPDRAQIVFGLLTDERGCPVAVEAFSGNTADPATLEAQIAKVRERFGLSKIVLVGDRGMLTSARIERLKELGGLGWVSCLRGPAIAALVEAGDLQLGLFDERNLAEITSPDFAGERLVVCRNPALAAERSRKRDELLAATEAALGRVAMQVERRSLRSAAAIGLRAGRVVNAKKMAKHFRLTIAEGEFRFERDLASIAAEAALDGLYVIRTSVPIERLDAAGIVETYKRLSAVERDFRVLKGDELAVRPIFHYREHRVRSHLFLCLLAAYVRWHLEAVWAPLLYRDEMPPARSDPVAPRGRSAGARRKERDHVTPDGLPVQSFPTLLRHLGTLTDNRVVPLGLDERAAFSKLSAPTPLQNRAFELLGFTPGSV